MVIFADNLPQIPTTYMHYIDHKYMSYSYLLEYQQKLWKESIKVI